MSADQEESRDQVMSLKTAFIEVDPGRALDCCSLPDGGTMEVAHPHKPHCGIWGIGLNNSEPGYWFGIISRLNPVMFTSRNMGVRGGSKAGVKNSTSKL